MASTFFVLINKLEFILFTYLGLVLQNLKLETSQLYADLRWAGRSSHFLLEDGHITYYSGLNVYVYKFFSWPPA